MADDFVGQCDICWNTTVLVSMDLNGNEAICREGTDAVVRESGGSR